MVIDKFFILLFGVVCPMLYSQREFSSKLYISNEKSIIPFTQDKLKAAIYYNDKVNIKIHNFMFVGVGNQFARKIKYGVTKENKFIAFSIRDTSIIPNPRPLAISLSLDSMFTDEYLQFTESFKKDEVSTSFTIEGLSGLDLTPLKEYYPSYGFYHLSSKPISITYHDFSVTESDIVLVNAISKKLKVWKYDLNEFKEKEKTGDVIESKLFKEYDWSEDSNFYICHLHGQLLLFTEKGTIYKLGEQAEKIGKLSDNLITSAIVVDNDHDKLYLLKKSYISKKLPFNKIIEKYAEEIKIK